MNNSCILKIIRSSRCNFVYTRTFYVKKDDTIFVDGMVLGDDTDYDTLVEWSFQDICRMLDILHTDLLLELNTKDVYICVPMLIACGYVIYCAVRLHKKRRHEREERATKSYELQVKQDQRKKRQNNEYSSSSSDSESD